MNEPHQRDADADRILERVRSGSWRADIEHAAERQRRHRVQLGSLALIIVAFGGLVAVANRTNDMASSDTGVSTPPPTVSTTVSPTTTPATEPPAATDPCDQGATPRTIPTTPQTVAPGDGEPPRTEPPSDDTAAPADQPCGWLASELNALISSECPEDHLGYAAEVVAATLQGSSLSDEWTIIEGDPGEPCSTVAILDIDNRQIHIVGAATCSARSNTTPLTVPPIEGPGDGSSESIDPTARCLQLATDLRIEVNAQCLNFNDAMFTVVNLLEEQGLTSDWEIDATDATGLCIKAWTDITTRTVTISDTPP